MLPDCFIPLVYKQVNLTNNLSWNREEEKKCYPTVRIETPPKMSIRFICLLKNKKLQILIEMRWKRVYFKIEKYNVTLYSNYSNLFFCCCCNIDLFMLLLFFFLIGNNYLYRSIVGSYYSIDCVSSLSFKDQLLIRD